MKGVFFEAADFVLCRTRARESDPWEFDFSIVNWGSGKVDCLRKASVLGLIFFK